MTSDELFHHTLAENARVTAECKSDVQHDTNTADNAPDTPATQPITPSFESSSADTHDKTSTNISPLSSTEVCYEGPNSDPDHVARTLLAPPGSTIVHDDASRLSTIDDTESLALSALRAELDAAHSRSTDLASLQNPADATNNDISSTTSTHISQGLPKFRSAVNQATDIATSLRSQVTTLDSALRSKVPQSFSRATITELETMSNRVHKTCAVFDEQTLQIINKRWVIKTLLLSQRGLPASKSLSAHAFECACLCIPTSTWDP